jgi:cytosine/creatinine deaminase
MNHNMLYTNARVPTGLTNLNVGDSNGLVECSISVVDGKIESLQLASDSDLPSPTINNVNLEGRIVLPGLIDVHTHLDKAFTWDRAPNLRGEFWDAIELLSNDKTNWTEEDLYRRASFALRCAEAHGTVALRTHVDTGLKFGDISHAVMNHLRSEWAGRIELQTVSLCGLEEYCCVEGSRLAEKTLQYPQSLLGGMPQMNPNLDEQLDYFFDLAAEMGAGVDLHVDENGLAEAECLRKIAKTVLRKSFSLPVTCGHVCSLAVQKEERALSTIDLVRQAGINIVSLPLCNLYLQGRPSERGAVRGTPRWRGVTLLHELLQAGVITACASDNVRDAFYAWGDFDMFEVFQQSIRIAHLDTRLQDACKMVARFPAEIMGFPNMGRFKAGADARLIAFEAKSLNELLARPNQKRELLGYHPDVSAGIPPYQNL